MNETNELSTINLTQSYLEIYNHMSSKRLKLMQTRHKLQERINALDIEDMQLTVGMKRMEVLKFVRDTDVIGEEEFKLEIANVLDTTSRS